MFHFVYRGRISEVIDSSHYRVLLDLGFHVHTPRTFAVPQSQERYSVDSDVIGIVAREDDGQWTGELLAGDDENGLAMMWHYPAKLIKVVDGDTIDARVDLGCSVSIDERFRLSDISAPEIHGAARGNPDYARGVSAKAYLEARFTENNGKMTIVSSRQGKWRRWLADIFVSDTRMTLNLELVDVGFADFSASRHRS